MSIDIKDTVPFRQKDILEISKKMTVFDVSITGQQKKYIKKFMLYAIGRNINKYHRFLHDEIKKFEGKTEEKAA